MTTAWLWDTRYAWHDTGDGAVYLSAVGPIQPGLSFAENPLTKTRFRDLVEATPEVHDGLLKLCPRHAALHELERFAPDLILVASGLDASAFDPLGRQLLLSTHYRRMSLILMEVAARLCGGRLLCLHEGGYSEAYVPFCGVAIVEALLGLEPVVVDPFLPWELARPAQELQPHQDAAVTAAEALVPGVPGHR